MTDNTETNITNETEIVEPTEAPETEGVVESGNREAAKYRRQLRETETELETARAQLDEAQAEIKQHRDARRMDALQEDIRAESTNITPDLLIATGHALDDLVAEDGTTNRKAIKAAITATRTKLGLPFDHPMHVPSEGKIPNRQTHGNGFENAFSPQQID